MTSKTIKQMADELGVSRQAVHQKLKKNPDLMKYTETSRGIIYIRGEGVTLLKAAFAKSKKTDDLQAFENNNTDLQVEDLKAQIAAKNDELEQLKQRLKDKETYINTLAQQIDLKDKQISDTTTALLQAQQLHAADRQRLLAIEEQQKQAQQEQQTISQPERKPTIWERLTGKGRKQ